METTTIEVSNESIEKMKKAATGIKLTKEFFSTLIANFIGILIYAFILKILFPIFIGIIAIQWPEWVIIHAGRFISWVIVLLTVGILINFIKPTLSVRIKKDIKTE